MSDIPHPGTTANPSGWPAEILPVVERALVCEFASLTRAGTPITLPLTPFLGEDGRTLEVSTGLTYPAKAERARRDPRVAMLFSTAAGTGLETPPVVLVTGLATVRDRDLQANTDRYVRGTLAKMPGAYRQVPWVLLKRQRWYWTRIWIQITPLFISWWREGNLDRPPQRWEAPPRTTAPPSDPAPPGRQPPRWQPPPRDWRPRAAHAARHLGRPVLTVVDADGFPWPVPTRAAALAPDGFDLTLPPTGPAGVGGPACLSFHTSAYSPTAFHQENSTFVGEVESGREPERAHFRVARAIADWSLPASPLRKVWSLATARWRLDARLRAEAARRGQPLPDVRR